jgi:hypothetical protein
MCDFYLSYTTASTLYSHDYINFFSFSPQSFLPTRTTPSNQTGKVLEQRHED